MNRRDFLALLMLAILVLIFVAYEMAGEVLPGWHTLSFLAQNHSWLAWLIGGLFIAGGAVGFLWWRRHLSRPIPK